MLSVVGAVEDRKSRGKRGRGGSYLDHDSSVLRSGGETGPGMPQSSCQRHTQPRTAKPSLCYREPWQPPVCQFPSSLAAPGDRVPTGSEFFTLTSTKTVFSAVPSFCARLEGLLEWSWGHIELRQLPLSVLARHPVHLLETVECRHFRCREWPASPPPQYGQSGSAGQRRQVQHKETLVTETHLTLRVAAHTRRPACF